MHVYVCMCIFMWVNICACMCAYPGGDQESNGCYLPQFLEIGPLPLAWSFHMGYTSGIASQGTPILHSIERS